MMNLRRLTIHSAVVVSAVMSVKTAHADERKTLLIPVSPYESSITPQRSAVKTNGAPAAPAAPKFNMGNYQARHMAALDRALSGDAKGAIQALNSLLSLQLPADERDRVYLSIGRVHYQLGNDMSAVDAYKEVRKGGPSWLEALEERATAQMRLGQPQEALASLKTVFTPLFQDRILSEPYFLASLAHLRVCDYKSVFRTLELFKTRFRTKVQGWEQAGDESSKLRLRETSETIQKLNLVEAEAIQRLYLDEAGKRQSGSVPKIAKERHQLTFPSTPDLEEKEVWLDEVDDYRVSIKGCPQVVNETIAQKDGDLE